MSTPFASYANAVLVFQRAIGTPTIDALGNTSATTADFVVRAYLKQVKSAAKNQMPWDGGQDNVVEVEGRCVEPAALPSDIVPGVKAQATIGGVEGEFILEATIASAFGVDELLGAKLQGRFIVRVAFGEAL